MPDERTIPQALDSEETFRQVVASAHELHNWGEPYETEGYLHALEERVLKTNLRTLNPPLAEAYDGVIVYLRFAVLQFLEEKDLLDLFRKHLLDGFTIDVDLKKQIELLLLLYGEAGARSVARKLVYALLENDELIGSQSLTIPGAPMPLPPSVRNWIVDFLSVTSARQKPTSLEIATYFNQSSNARKLNAQQRETLRQVLAFYAFLLNPPIIDFLHSLARPKTPVTVGTKPTEDFRSSLLQSLYEEATMEEAVQAEEERLLGGGGYTLERVSAELKDALTTGNAPKLQACLFLLGRSGDLKDLLGRDQELQNFFERFVLTALLPSLKALRPTADLATLAQDFRRQPNRPVYIKSFLQYVLTKSLKDDPVASAALGIRILSLLYRQGYTEAATMAFFDEETKQYRWAQTGLDSQGIPILL